VVASSSFPSTCLLPRIGKARRRSSLLPDGVEQIGPPPSWPTSLFFFGAGCYRNIRAFSVFRPATPIPFPLVPYIGPLFFSLFSRRRKSPLAASPLIDTGEMASLLFLLPLYVYFFSSFSSWMRGMPAFFSQSRWGCFHPTPFFFPVGLR